MVALKQGSVPDVIANKLDHLLILTSGTEQYLITCTNKKYKFLLTTTLTISDIASPKSGEIVMVPDFDNYVIKLIVSGDGNKLSTEIPILENVEDREYYGRTATEIKNVVDIKYNEQQPLIAFVYDNDEMSVPTLDDFINSKTDFLSKNDYVYYVAFEFCK